MMRFGTMILAGALLCGAAEASHQWGVQLETMRCGRSLVTVGDAAFELLDRCGEPDYRNVVQWLKISDQLSGFNALASHTLEDSAYLVSEEWVYKPGRGRLTKILTVTGGVLTDIRVAKKR